jgi:uncharacterized Zn finger protein (UPF0148 family)
MPSIIAYNRPKMFKINCGNCKSILECSKNEISRTVGFKSTEFFICPICGESVYEFSEAEPKKELSTFDTYKLKAKKAINKLQETKPYIKITKVVDKVNEAAKKIIDKTIKKVVK